MLPKDVYPGLVQWAEQLTGIPWYRRGEAWKQGETVGELRITTVRPSGADYQDEELNPDSESPGEDDLLLRMRGDRELVVEFRVESIYQDVIDTAQQKLEVLRLKAGRSDARALLRSAGLDLAFGSAQPLTVVERTDENGHRLSVAVLDVTFLAHFAEDDPEEGTYVEKVRITNSVEGVPSGWDDEVLP